MLKTGARATDPCLQIVAGMIEAVSMLSCCNRASEGLDLCSIALTVPGMPACWEEVWLPEHLTSSITSLMQCRLMMVIS